MYRTKLDYDECNIDNLSGCFSWTNCPCSWAYSGGDLFCSGTGWHSEHRNLNYFVNFFSKCANVAAADKATEVFKNVFYYESRNYGDSE